jgi:hypothetical protein
MATNLALDQELVERAFRVSGERTKNAAVTRALQEFIARREQRRIAELFGKLDWMTRSITRLNGTANGEPAR